MSPKGGVSAARHDPRLGLVALLCANVVSVAGGAASLVAMPWFVLATTGSTVATGLTAVCETVPLVLVAVTAGSVVDRLGAAAVRVGSDVVCAATVLAIPVLHAGPGLPFWLLLVLVAANGAARAPAPAASLVLLHALAAADATSPDRARSAYAASVRLAGALSAPLAGVVIAWKGAPAALALDAASFAVSALALTATLRLRRVAGTTGASTLVPRRMLAGVGPLVHDRVLRSLCALVFALAVLEGAWVSVLAPAYGQRVLHSPAALGLLLGVFAAGALAGALAYPWAASRIAAHRLLWLGLAISTCLRYGVLGAGGVLPVLCVAVLLAGVAAGLLAPLWLGALGERVQPSLQGHAFGITFALEQGATAFGALAGGVVLTRLSVSASLVLAAGAGAVLALVAAATGAPGVASSARKSASGTAWA